MSLEIELTFPELEVTARASLCEREAPRASELLWRLLETPFVGSAVHAIHAGPAVLIPVPPRHGEPAGGQIPVENETNQPRPGDILLLPPSPEDDAHEAVADGVTVAVFYGEKGRPLTPAGWQPGVVAASVTRGLAALRDACRRVRFEGAREVRLARAVARPKSDAAILRTDGASLGNPGPAGAGFVLETEDGQLVAEGSIPLAAATNNVAEYRAVIAGVRESARRGVRALRVLSDSELICRQLTGAYRVKAPALKPLHRQALNLLRGFATFSVEHVAREENRRADRLAAEGARKSKERIEKHAD
jgi:ribonuclease HI